MIIIGRAVGISLQRCAAVTLVDAPAQCPECGCTTLRRVHSDPPWCASCEWNLGAWPEPKRKRSRKRVMRDRSFAFGMNQRLLREFEGHAPGRPRRTRAALVLGCASLVLLVSDLALIGFGLYWLITGWFALRVLAVIMVLTGIECRLRFPRMDTFGEVSRSDAPQLWAVVDQARAALHAPPIDHLVITNDFNASCGHRGLRRRVVLKIGLPLWAALSPEARLAVLGHELGHLVNGDPRTSLLTQPALSTFGRLAEIFDPDDLMDSGNGLADLVSTVFAFVLLKPLHLLFVHAHIGLFHISAQGHQRAEIYADALALRLGGSEGAVELATVLVAEDAVLGALRCAARAGEDPAGWRAEVAPVLHTEPARLRHAEQRSIRYDVSRSASHPPSGIRLRLVRSWPATAPSAAIPADALAAADCELARRYKSARRAILNGSLD